MLKKVKIKGQDTYEFIPEKEFEEWYSRDGWTSENFDLIKEYANANVPSIQEKLGMNIEDSMICLVKEKGKKRVMKWVFEKWNNEVLMRWPEVSIDLTEENLERMIEMFQKALIDIRK